MFFFLAAKVPSKAIELRTFKCASHCHYSAQDNTARYPVCGSFPGWLVNLGSDFGVSGICRLEELFEF